MEPGVSIVLVTVPSREVGENIARALVEERLCACVNIIPGLISIYRWEGDIERAEEVLLVLKTQAGLLPKLEQSIRTHHPYSVPEFVALPVSAVGESYLNWLISETS